jgi:hypothetical protein
MNRAEPRPGDRFARLVLVSEVTHAKDRRKG